MSENKLDMVNLGVKIIKGNIMKEVMSNIIMKRRRSV